MSKVKKICVIKGGLSSEREVSLVSAAEFVSVLNDLGYAVSEFDFTGDTLKLLEFLTDNNPDCILNALHGGAGENGCVQGLFNMMKIPYTHSGVVASAIAMNKPVACQLFAQNNIQVPKGKVLLWDEFFQDPLQNRFFSFPIVIKPYDGGSSAGVHIIKDIEQLNSIQWNSKYVFVEEYIPGLELTVGVMDGTALEVTNICVKQGFYDYKNKYTAGESYHEIPAPIPDNIRALAINNAIKAYAILGCRGVSRADFRYNDVTNELYILEVNTQPGMTSTSLLPEQAAYVGISFHQLVQWIVEKACYEE